MTQQRKGSLRTAQRMGVDRGVCWLKFRSDKSLILAQIVIGTEPGPFPDLGLSFNNLSGMYKLCDPHLRSTGGWVIAYCYMLGGLQAELLPLPSVPGLPIPVLKTLSKDYIT